MAQNMRDIKRRIRSINSTKQITKAMELVAASKLRRAREKAELGRPYFEKMIDTIQEIVKGSPGMRNPYMEARDVKNRAFIIITGDRGLAGGYNSNVIKLGVETIGNKDNASILAIGSTGRDYFKRRDYNIMGEYLGISESPSFSDAKEIGRTVMNLFKDGVIDEAYLIYTKFVSTISQQPQSLKLLPLSPENFQGEQEEKQEGAKMFMDYEPSAEGVLARLIPNYVQNTLYGAMLESSASELGARRMAMESATENANEMIDDLTLSYNRARQGAITQEISEIVGGAEALK
ncbi:ATP synthase F1 subunit gamma [Irregularibacter muris]|jgi:F-type H+-transporting ATPase subunit gamma|uniref:ATP synthase gamma chain n=1 Tax=Irregularibacter muris TaxID=1796619 RepID=A0AAE3HIM6_9FIRM|nr:ATP synthase F1 subunit gamma [Irregularibacter muris]MCR1900202.1 ATP synthase F1 subunit gamma [Irregularibacter muris]